MPRQLHTFQLLTLLIMLPLIIKAGAVSAEPGTFGSDAPIILHTFSPNPLPLSDPEVINPMRGLYRWNAQEVAPQSRSGFDTYAEYSWRDLEPSYGRYDFSPIERDLKQAQREGRRLSFRIYALARGEGVAVPAYLVDLMPQAWRVQQSYIPDWNDPDFVARAAALITALSQHYDNDPGLAWIGIGLYGDKGKWDMSAFEYPAPTGALDMSEAQLKALVDSYVAAFAYTRLIMMTQKEVVFLYALNLSAHIGWQAASLGSEQFSESSFIQALRSDPVRWSLFGNRWKTAPVIAEFTPVHQQRDPDIYQTALAQAAEYHVSMVSNGNTLAWGRLSSAGQTAFLELGKRVGYRYQLETLTLAPIVQPGSQIPLEASWKNTGNAPTYERWSVVLQLRQPGSADSLWEWPLKVDLSTILPATEPSVSILGDSLSIPADLLAGTYDLHVIVRHPAADQAPLSLAIEGRLADGSYRLGQIQVRSQVPATDQPSHIYLPIVIK